MVCMCVCVCVCVCVFACVCVYRRIQYFVTVLRGIIQITYILTIRLMFSAIYRVVAINYEYVII